MGNTKKISLTEKHRLYLLNNLRWDAVGVLAAELGISKQDIKHALKRNADNSYDRVIVVRLAQLSLLKGFI